MGNREGYILDFDNFDLFVEFKDLYFSKKLKIVFHIIVLIMDLFLYNKKNMLSSFECFFLLFVNVRSKNKKIYLCFNFPSYSYAKLYFHRYRNYKKAQIKDFCLTFQTFNFFLVKK